MSIGPRIMEKTFSKKWWENIWYYYKWYIIGIAAASAVIVFAFIECANTKPADFTMTYIGGLEAMGQIEAYQIEDEFAQIVQDINSDGENKVKFNIIYLDNNTQSEEMASMYNMADIEMAGGDSVVMFFSKDFLERYSKYGFYDLTDYAKKYEVDEELLKRYDDGTVYAIQMGQNPIFTKFDTIKADELYMVVRPMRENDKSKWQQQNYNHGLEMAQYIISGGRVFP